MICIAETDARPLYEQVYAAVREEIACGALVQGAALPPIRKLADELRVSRNTVSHAYQLLVSEGYVRAERGSGYFVDCLAETGRAQPAVPAVSPAAEPELACDFRYQTGSAADVPWTKWRRYVQEALLQAECCGAGARGSGQGSFALRENLCRCLQAGRGVRCAPEQMVICAGPLSALRTVLGLLPARPQCVAWEEPGSGAVRRVFEQAGVRVCPVGVQEDGIDLTALRRTGCNLLYVTPAHQFPTGAVTTPEKRRALLRWAAENDALIIENDHDGAFSCGARRLPALQALDTAGRVIHIGALTDVLGPAMQCAYAVLPAQLSAQDAARCRDQDAALPDYHQLALAAFLRDGLFERQARTMAARSREKYAILCDCLQREGQGIAALMGQPSGAHALLRIPRCTDQGALLAWLRTNGVGLDGTRDCWADPARAREDVFLLGFGAIPARELRQDVQRLLDLLRLYFRQCAAKNCTQ